MLNYEKQFLFITVPMCYDPIDFALPYLILGPDLWGGFILNGICSSVYATYKHSHFFHNTFIFVRLLNKKILHAANNTLFTFIKSFKVLSNIFVNPYVCSTIRYTQSSVTSAISVIHSRPEILTNRIRFEMIICHLIWASVLHEILYLSYN